MATIDWHQRTQKTDLRIRHCIEGDIIDLSEGEKINKYSPLNWQFALFTRRRYSR